MDELYEPESPLSPYSGDEDSNFDNNEDSYLDLISLSQPHTQTLATPVASHKSARQTGRSAQANPLMPNFDAASQPAPVRSNAGLPYQQDVPVPPGTPLSGQEPTANTTSGQQTNPLSTLQALLTETLSQLQSCSTPQSTSQEIPAALSALSIASQTPHKADVEHTLFDPSNLVERKFFTGSSEEICSYLNKYFTNGLASEQRLETVKRYKRPDIPSMRVQKLDNLFQRSDLYAVRARDDAFNVIQRSILFSVGPLSEPLGKLTANEPVQPTQIIQYISATLTLIGTAVVNTVRTRRKQALRSINSSLSNDVDTVCTDPDPTFYSASMP